jgi:asparagine N-glycosylation enzyme membrane subunit Stt3
MDHDLMKIFLILIGALVLGGFAGFFNIIYGTILLTIFVAYIAVTFFWKDLLIEIAKFISSFIFPKRWRH